MSIDHTDDYPIDIDFDDDDNDDIFDCPVQWDDQDDDEIPDTWTIITAIDYVLRNTRGSRLRKAFWEKCKSPLAFLRQELGLTDTQIIFLAILLETGVPMTWRALAHFIGCSRITAMTYSEEVEAMVDKRWFMKKMEFDGGRNCPAYSLAFGMVEALRNNKPFVPEKLDGLSIQEFVQKVAEYSRMNMPDHCTPRDEIERWYSNISHYNQHIKLCEELLSFDDIHSLTLGMLILGDYDMYAGEDTEGVSMDTVNNFFSADYQCNFIRQSLKNGQNPLQTCNIIEPKCTQGLAEPDTFVLTDYARRELLDDYSPSHSKCRGRRKDLRGYLTDCQSIKEKKLFYNESERKQVERLASLLQSENLKAIQGRLKEQGMRQGVACLFYGTPGTGKTETVLQLARQTGRNLMQVDIASLRDKWVGESEKNIKQIFSVYKSLCESSDITPILFFNEADAIFNKRSENVAGAVDKMENSLQNIILQEMETLDGILIATTNLTHNLDKAFERRFLFKIEFRKPECNVKALIWNSMMKDLSEDQVRQLASRYDFSGGQIENIARKRTIDYILSGHYSTLEQINEYCKSELLARNNERTHISGFS